MFPATVLAQDSSDTVSNMKPVLPAPTHADVIYGKVDQQELKLDLYLIEKKSAPLIIYIHGGAWHSGSKAKPPILGLLESGYHIASLEYRSTKIAPFPANVHDIKAAIRFLRAHANKFGYDPERFVCMGSSAGSHLAMLVGVTNQHPELEGNIGEHAANSSNIQAIVSFYGASNLSTILSQSTPFGTEMRKPALTLLLGGLPETCPERAALASPVTHVDQNDPPLLLFHGDADPQMPPAQSQEMKERYQQFKLPVDYQIIQAGKHGGTEFYNQERLKQVDSFLKVELKHASTH